ncbi:hypothetical protein HED51_14760 [Ochrobactrum grignonense]|nr:hypothetical protein [Brucella grignonensis]
MQRLHGWLQFEPFLGFSRQLTINCAGCFAVFFSQFLSNASKKMKDFNISITSTTRRRKLSDGTIAEYPQWYCEYKDPILKSAAAALSIVRRTPKPSATICW